MNFLNFIYTMYLYSMYYILYYVLCYIILQISKDLLFLQFYLYCSKKEVFTLLGIFNASLLYVFMQSQKKTYKEMHES